ncbi:MAG: DUF2971 domain-containing protein [Alphaproteobacteria bacterium]|nr:DUF2971 domain-containing protein [Alphaproteobacteria bacterium]
MTWDTANTMALEKLFHYQSYDPNNETEDHDRLKDVILEQKLYFSKPNNFNDPWDCRPWFKVNDLADSAVLDRHIRLYIDIARKHCPNLSEDEIQRRAIVFRNEPGRLVENLKILSQEMWKAIGDRYRVYCLSSKSDNELMWAHYSNKHQGICLEFDCRTEFICQALKVSYQEELPHLGITSDLDEEHLKPLVTKSAAWLYEDEYRLIAQEKCAATTDDTLLAQNNFVDLPNGTLTGIIVGCLASNWAVNAIKELVKCSTNSINVKQAVRADDKYRLSIVNC